MPDVELRDATASDFETICSLNLAEVQHTSPMDASRLEALHALAFYHRVGCINGAVASFLLAMRDGAPYRNINFEWFARRYARFVYVDRIVVSASSRGAHLGSLLYEDLFCHARDNRIPVITCEYNIHPPNEPSRVFHEKFGFKEQGTQWLADGTKQVSLQVALT